MGSENKSNESKSSPALTPGFVPLPAAVVDEWLPRLTGSQLKLLLVVVRQTEGFRDPATGRRKAEDWLTHRRLMHLTGCASQAVSGSVDALARVGLVRVRAAGGGSADTPQHRRAATRLLYGLGPALLPNGGGGSPAPPTTLKSGLRKPKTTKETRDKRSNSLVVFENQRLGKGLGVPSRPAGEDWAWRKRDARWMRAGDVREKPA
jgi:hypothetical protein